MKLLTYTHQVKSSIEWRRPNIGLTLFFYSPVWHPEQGWDESVCSSDVNWSSRSRGDIYVKKKNNYIIHVSWKVESVSYVSGPCGIEDKTNEKEILSDIWDSVTADETARTLSTEHSKVYYFLMR